ncbi:hypothetical protein QVD17_00461 [Tagetes erecta]|uniref:Uncharacterized protein n=1 Tax=Tagetes erecta TaxID=13708 RepID=A0AAD8LA88_TARER|nr:hypothetical protein QVD17_00461 [Tagetes erecta]
MKTIGGKKKHHLQHKSNQYHHCCMYVYIIYNQPLTTVMKPFPYFFTSNKHLNTAQDPNSSHIFSDDYLYTNHT